MQSFVTRPRTESIEHDTVNCEHNTGDYRRTHKSKHWDTVDEQIADCQASVGHQLFRRNFLEVEARAPRGLNFAIDLCPELLIFTNIFSARNRKESKKAPLVVSGLS